MKELFRLRTVAAACAALVLTVGCGSSSYDSAPPPAQPLPPDTMAQEDAAASASTDGFIAFLQRVIALLTLEGSEPRNVGGITPPVTETAEPTAI